MITYLKALRSMGYKLKIFMVENELRGSLRSWYFEDVEILKKDASENWNFVFRPDFIVHLASIASPIFYRKFPLETIEANIAASKNALDFATKQGSKLLIMSSSEVYGDPDSSNIPTKESYWGNVSTMGPRAAYDESKRLSETLCWIYQQNFNTQVSIARPFNFFGPGMRLDDGRVIPDMISKVLLNQDIKIMSDGTPTRTFCYIKDAVIALVKITLTADKQSVYNVGNESPEVSISDLATKVQTIALNVSKRVGIYEEKSILDDYLVHNPKRRCPNVSKIRNELGWEAQTPLDDGLRRTLSHFMEINS